ncbi:hypothetical protein ABBQ32_000420 [Trebouxia sp. C0010 RCD-2024]
MPELAEPLAGTADFTLISQGAEARVWEGQFLGRPVIMKQRFRKKYRHPVLDTKLTVGRLNQEVRSMLRARKTGVLTPCIFFVENDAATIFMERIDGQSVRDVLLSGNLTPADIDALLQKIGHLLATLHDGGLIHGDLTTSNMLVRKSDGAVVLIDLGLSFNSTIPEDKGVDLYVLERAFTSAHSKQTEMFDTLMTSYKKHSRQWSAVFNKFAEVRMRGRKRAMVG